MEPTEIPLQRAHALTNELTESKAKIQVNDLTQLQCSYINLTNTHTKDIKLLFYQSVCVYVCICAIQFGVGAIDDLIN